MKSGRLYLLVTKYWPRIAAGLVLMIGLLEFVVGGLTADSGLEFYVFTWATMCAGLWFVFEKAEAASAVDMRDRVSERLRADKLKSLLSTIPDQFAGLVDLTFGEKHWSRRAFNRSCVASFFAVIMVLALNISFGAWSGDPESSQFGRMILVWAIALWGSLVSTLLVRSRIWTLLVGAVVLALLFGPLVVHDLGGDQTWALDPIRAALAAGTILAWAVILNFIPDYVSLLETRWMLKWMSGSGSIIPLLIADALVTATISLVAIGAVYTVLVPPEIYSSGVYVPGWPRSFDLTEFLSVVLKPPETSLVAGEIFSQPTVLQAPVLLSLLNLAFYSAFFTSVWLWLYAASVLVSRVLLKMNDGVGFLLRVTDVENQPFRSMGFVSVLIVSGLFLLGLPFVLL